MRASTSVSPWTLGGVRLQLAQPIEHQPPARARHAVGIRQVQHRIPAAPELHALILRRQEPAAPEAGVERLIDFAGRDEHDKRRQILVVAAEPVVNPRAHAGPAGDLRAGLEEGDRGIVIDRLGEHRADDAELVDDLRGLGKEIADPGAVLPVLTEPELRSRERQGRLIAGHAGQPLSLPHRIRQLLAVALPEHGLVVERLHLRRAAGHEEIDDALRLGRHVELAAQHAAVLRAPDDANALRRIDQVRESNPAQAHAEAAENRAPRHSGGRQCAGAFRAGHGVLSSFPVALHCTQELVHRHEIARWTSELLIGLLACSACSAVRGSWRLARERTAADVIAPPRTLRGS